ADEVADSSDDEQDAQRSWNEARAHDQHAEREQPESPEDRGDRDALAVRAQEQVGQGVQLGSLENSEELGAAPQHERGDVVERVDEHDWHGDQGTQDDHQSGLALVHGSEQPIEGQDQEDGNDLMGQIAHDAQAEERPGSPEVVGRGPRVVVHDQLSGHVQEADRTDEGEQEVQPSGDSSLLPGCRHASLDHAPSLARGSATWNAAPRSALRSAHSRPPCEVTRVRQIERPMPRPPGLVVWNGWNNASTSSGRPTPQSSTPMRISFCAIEVMRVRLRSCGGFDAMASHAFRIRLRRICWSCTRSVRAGGRSRLVRIETETARSIRSLRVRESSSSRHSFTFTGRSATSPRRIMVRSRRMISPALWSSLTMSSRMARSSPRSWGSLDIRCWPACALLRMLVSGWFNSCAREPESALRAATRERWASSSRCSWASAAACFWCVISIETPSIRGDAPLAGPRLRPRAAIHRTERSGRMTRYSAS